MPNPTLIPIPKLSKPAAEYVSEKTPIWLVNWLLGWLPDPNTKQWTKGGAGGFIFRILRQIENAGFVIPAELLAVFAARIRQNYVDRGVFNDGIFDPYFAPEAPPYPNAWDPMHFSVSLPAELTILAGKGTDKGDSPPFFFEPEIALRLVESYRRSMRWRHFNMSWSEGQQHFDTNGRLRNAARAIQACIDSYDVLAIGGPLPIFLSWIAVHAAQLLSEVAKGFPLVANPKPDHLPVPHLEVFMMGTLVSVLDRLQTSALVTDPACPAHVLATAKALATQFTTLIEKAVIDTSWGWIAYDLAWDVEKKKPYLHELTIAEADNPPEPGKDRYVRRGMSGVNIWLYLPLLRYGSMEFGKPVASVLRESAKTTLKGYPMLQVEHMNEVVTE